MTTFGKFQSDYNEQVQLSTGSGLVISREEVERGTDTVLGKTLEDNPYDEVVVDPPMQETERTAAGNEKEERAKAEVVDNEPKAMGDKERENVYDEIVSVARIPEASSMKELGRFISYMYPT